MKKLLISLGLVATSVSFAQTEALQEFAIKNSDKITSVGKAAYMAKQNGTSVVDAATQALVQPEPNKSSAFEIPPSPDKAGVAAALNAFRNK